MKLLIAVTTLALTYFAIGAVARQDAASPSLSARRPFVVDSTKSTYPFTLHVVGSFEVRGDSISVSVTDGAIVSAIPTYIGEAGVATEVQVAVGLGVVGNEGWRFEAASPPQFVARALKPGERVSIPPMEFTVAGVAGRPLAEQWLTAQLTVRQTLPGIRAGVLASYACAYDNVLGTTDASRKRSDAMQRSYSTVC